MVSRSSTRQPASGGRDAGQTAVVGRPGAVGDAGEEAVDVLAAGGGAHRKNGAGGAAGVLDVAGGVVAVEEDVVLEGAVGLAHLLREDPAVGVVQI